MRRRLAVEVPRRALSQIYRRTSASGASFTAIGPAPVGLAVNDGKHWKSYCYRCGVAMVKDVYWKVDESRVSD